MAYNEKPDKQNKDEWKRFAGNREETPGNIRKYTPITFNTDEVSVINTVDILKLKYLYNENEHEKAK